MLFLGYTIGVNNQLHPLDTLSKRSCINADDREWMQEMKDLLQDGSVYLEEID